MIEEKQPYFLHLENLIVVIKKLQYIYLSNHMSRGKAISGPQAEVSTLVESIYVLAKYSFVPAYLFY